MRHTPVTYSASGRPETKIISVIEQSNHIFSVRIDIGDVSFIRQREANKKMVEILKSKKFNKAPKDFIYGMGSYMMWLGKQGGSDESQETENRAISAETDQDMF